MFFTSLPPPRYRSPTTYVILPNCYCGVTIPNILLRYNYDNVQYSQSQLYKKKNNDNNILQ